MWNGLWSLDLGPWTLDLGPWTLDLGPWTLDLGPWTLDLGPWTLDLGPYAKLRRARFAGRPRNVCGRTPAAGLRHARTRPLGAKRSRVVGAVSRLGHRYSRACVGG